MFADMDIEDSNPELCPYCSSDQVQERSHGRDGSVRYCLDCRRGFVLWYDEPYDRYPVEVCDEHGNHLF